MTSHIDSLVGNYSALGFDDIYEGVARDLFSVARSIRPFELPVTASGWRIYWSRNRKI